MPESDVGGAPERGALSIKRDCGEGSAMGTRGACAPRSGLSAITRKSTLGRKGGCVEQLKRKRPEAIERCRESVFVYF
jgi:hypothetical protein